MQTSDARARDYQLSDREFQVIRRLVRKLTGIALAESKRELVYGRLVRRLRRLQLSGFGEYIALLEGGEPAELEQFTNAITTNLTSFFREAHHFEFLRDTAFPEIAARNPAARRLRIWSAGCSSGEEPYSLAIVLQESIARFRGWDVKILATDLDSQVLGSAVAGEYPADRFEKMSTARRDRWFRPNADGAFVAAPELKALITFKPLNLMGAWPFRGPFDVVFCRNVIIYFDKPTQQALFERIGQLQRAQDFLCIGHSESLFNVSEQYQLVGKTIYRRLP
jgi:chemotaxis protein methyltransferase CheR